MGINFMIWSTAILIGAAAGASAALVFLLGIQAEEWYRHWKSRNRK